ncbi:MAG: hypothetical protein ACK555_20720 [Acidobacteriota bacterium]
MADVIRDLGGPEVIHGRCRAFWRGGDGRNISVDIERWFDHVTGRGGGPLQMAVEVLGEAEGRRWYQERYGRVTCRPRAARRVPVVADELLSRIVAALADLRKQVAVDDDELALWANVDRIARTGGEEWRRFRERVEIADPEMYRHWIKCAVELDADAQRATALVVAMLAEVSA